MAIRAQRTLLNPAQKRLIKGNYLYRIANMPLRAWRASATLFPKFFQIAMWTVSSREETNFTYELTRGNILVLASLLSVVTGKPVEQITRYIDEARHDETLRNHILKAVEASPFRYVSDHRVDFGRRLGWYAIARALRPKVIIETGVDKGLGSVLLSAALLRNSAEGYPGQYFGTELNPEAGWMLSGDYARVGKILYGDSIKSLRAFDRPIDLFINDSDHSSDYERQEYNVIGSKLAPGAVVLGDNSHCTDELVEWSIEQGRAFLFFQERIFDHWYPGGGIGISYESAKRAAVI